ncbi:MHJ_0274 family protein [Mycoplasma todarodis]|uniref:MHJ_0274 family protein n=1 Tax=Mycoplasma todarodis TaxID=1937191 RepID=UPI003B2E8117
MNSIAMWGILGGLIAIVIGFLIISALLDRKKRKKAKIEKAEIDKLKNAAVGNMAILINLVVEKNKKKLKEFVPSVGKLKMSDINNMAKDEMKKIEKSDWFPYLKEEDILMENFLVISKEKSNNWEKKNQKQIKYFKELEEALDKELYKEFTRVQKSRLTRKYK